MTTIIHYLLVRRLCSLASPGTARDCGDASCHRSTAESPAFSMLCAWPFRSWLRLAAKVCASWDRQGSAAGLGSSAIPANSKARLALFEGLFGLLEKPS